MTETFEVCGMIFTEGEEMRYEYLPGSYLTVTVIGPRGTTNLFDRCLGVACWFNGRVVSLDPDRLFPESLPTVTVELGVEDVCKWLAPKFDDQTFSPEDHRIREACLEALIEAGEA